MTLYIHTIVYIVYKKNKKIYYMYTERKMYMSEFPNHNANELDEVKKDIL